MDDKEMGLPLEYQYMPEYFDAHNVSEETEAKNEHIEKILKQHQAKTVLDLTCGTGSQVFHLVKKGHEVTGADFSPALLEIARNKAQQENIDVTFIDDDMRTLKVGEFDAVITIFNAIGHLTKTDFGQALQNIHSNLKDGGIYVFDIFNLQAMTDQAVKDLAMDITKTVDDTEIHNIQHSTIDRENGLLTSHDQYTITKKGSDPKKLTNSFTLQIYTAAELREMLARNGFETLSQTGMNGEMFIENETLNILTVAKKI